MATDILPDNEIIHRVIGGEKDLYALIVRRYNQRLYRVAMSIVNDDAEAEDIMQVAYIKAFENLAKFAFRSVFSTWLTRILINESLLRLKKRKHSLHVNGDIMDNEVYRQHKTESPTPLTRMLNQELKIILEEAIRNLPEKYRTVFVMREMENMNLAETKECLGISEVNVKVRLNRAKALLRDSLKEFYKNEDIFRFHLSRCDRVTNYVMERIKNL
ncbi:MAG: RNA polymerase sigma factor [Bacteroidota bacterium]|nr:RNA polymerase sigma factor [Bacteroidota bacterium]